MDFRDFAPELGVVLTAAGTATKNVPCPACAGVFVHITAITAGTAAIKAKSGMHPMDVEDSTPDIDFCPIWNMKTGAKTDAGTAIVVADGDFYWIPNLGTLSQLVCTADGVTADLYPTMYTPVGVGLASPDAIIGPGDPVIDSFAAVAINLTTGADQVLVSSAANKQIWVYAWGMSVGDADGQTLSLQDEDNVAKTGIMEFKQYGGVAFSPSGNFAMPLFKCGTDKDLEIDITGGDADGILAYAIVSV